MLVCGTLLWCTSDCFFPSFSLVVALSLVPLVVLDMWTCLSWFLALVLPFYPLYYPPSLFQHSWAWRIVGVRAWRFVGLGDDFLDVLDVVDLFLVRSWWFFLILKVLSARHWWCCSWFPSVVNSWFKGKSLSHSCLNLLLGGADSILLLLLAFLAQRKRVKITCFCYT